MLHFIDKIWQAKRDKIAATRSTKNQAVSDWYKVYMTIMSKATSQKYEATEMKLNRRSQMGRKFTAIFVVFFSNFIKKSPK